MSAKKWQNWALCLVAILFAIAWSDVGDKNKRIEVLRAIVTDLRDDNRQLRQKLGLPVLRPLPAHLKTLPLQGYATEAIEAGYDTLPDEFRRGDKNQ